MGLRVNDLISAPRTHPATTTLSHSPGNWLAPVIGYLDDVIIVPLGIVLAVRLIPPEMLFEHRKAAELRQESRPTNWVGAIFVVAIWWLAAAILVRLINLF